LPTRFAEKILVHARSRDSYGGLPRGKAARLFGFAEVESRLSRYAKR